MGLFSSIGKAINSFTGASSAAEQSYRYSSALATQNAKYQKEFAQNAHQWEIEDLKKAGLNPILSAGGSGASASGGGGTSIGVSAGTGGFSDLINSAAGLMKLSSELSNLEEDTELKRGLQGKTNQEIQKINTEAQVNMAKTKEIASKTLLNTAETAFTKRRGSGKGGSFSTPFGGASFHY